jgi:hypothetical protein
VPNVSSPTSAHTVKKIMSKRPGDLTSFEFLERERCRVLDELLVRRCSHPDPPVRCGVPVREPAFAAVERLERFREPD